MSGLTPSSAPWHLSVWFVSTLHTERACATVPVLALLPCGSSAPFPGADSICVGLSAFSLRHLQARARAHDGVPGAHSHVPVPGRGGPRAAHPVEREGQDFGSQQAPAQVHSLHSKLKCGAAWHSPCLPSMRVLMVRSRVPSLRGTQSVVSMSQGLDSPGPRVTLSATACQAAVELQPFVLEHCTA